MSKTAEPLAALVTAALAPVRRSPRTMFSVKLSLRFSAGELTSVTAPAWISGIGTLLFWMPSAMPFSLLVNLNWKVMCSFASPTLSMWISYKALGSSEK